MGMARISLTSLSSTVVTEAVRKSERGVLQGIGVSLVPSMVQMGRLWLEVGARLGGSADEQIDTIFFSGYPTQQRAMTWTGAYNLEPFEELYVKALSTVQILLIVNFKIHIGDP